MSWDWFREELVAGSCKDLPGSFRKLKAEEPPLLGHGRKLGGGRTCLQQTENSYEFKPGRKWGRSSLSEVRSCVGRKLMCTTLCKREL